MRQSVFRYLIFSRFVWSISRNERVIPQLQLVVVFLEVTEPRFGDFQPVAAYKRKVHHQNPVHK